MKRISIGLAAALACLAFAAVGTAAAESETAHLSRTCTTSANNVAGHKVTIKVTGKNVAASQAKYAKCPAVKKTVNMVIKEELLKPKPIEGFRITPAIVTKAPLVVDYSGLFRGADTATEIRLKFKIAYANN